jgi:DNA-binding NarL/FixJ family response regulator
VGYVAKAAADTELLSAIRAVANNRMFVDLKSNPSAMQEALLAEAKPPRTVNSLSSREREVLALLAQGFTNQEAADRLFLSVKTVETYRNRVGTKLGLRSRADYVRYAVEMGLLAPGKSAPEADQPPEQSS